MAAQIITVASAGSFVGGGSTGWGCFLSGAIVVAVYLFFSSFVGVFFFFCGLYGSYAGAAITDAEEVTLVVAFFFVDAFIVAIFWKVLLVYICCLFALEQLLS